MVKIDYLDPFMPYKVKPPAIMPEDETVRKKYSAYIVLAPTIQEELQYLSTNKVLQFRSLTKYFIEKRWEYKVYGKGKMITKLDEQGEITSVLLANKHGNLSQLDGVTTYLPTVKSRPLKDLNVLVEVNHVTDIILHNEKDNRRISYKVQELLKEYKRLYKIVAPGKDNYIGNYKKITLVIPMELWFDQKEFQNANMLLKPTSKNPMGQFLGLLNSTTLKAFDTILLCYGNTLLKLTAKDIPEEKGNHDPVVECIERYILRLFHTKLEEPIDNKEAETLQLAEKKTKVDIIKDDVIDKTVKDDEIVSKEAQENIKKTVEKAVNDAPEDTPSEEIQHAVSADDNLLTTSKLTGKSVESLKRDQMLKEKYKELKFGETPLTELLEVEETYKVPTTTVKANVVNESMKELKSDQLEKSYNENLFQHDLLNVLMHFSTAKPALYLNKDIKIEDASTPTDRVIKYTVEFEDENRKRHRFPFLMPKMYKEKYLFLNDQEFNISHQKLPYPITKTSPEQCQLVTNYKKIFIYRYGTNLSPRVGQIKKIFMSPDCPKCIKITKGDATVPNKMYLTTLEYDDIGSNMVRIQMGKSTSDFYLFYFVADDTRAVISETTIPTKVKVKTYDTEGNETVVESDDTTLIPLGYHVRGKEKDYYFISGASNIIYDQKGNSHGELSEFIINVLLEIDPKAEEFFSSVSTSSRFVYSQAHIMAEEIPLILVVGAADPNGLLGVLEKAKIKYQFTDKRQKVNSTLIGTIPFSDGYLTYERYPYENSLLLNGLSSFPTKEFSFYDMNSRDTYVELFDLMYNRRNLIDGIENFYYMMIDPITKDVLHRLDMPTDFTTLMLYCNGTLVDNTYQLDSDYHNARIRSNEIINALLYRNLASAWEPFKDGRADKFSIPEDCIIKELLTSYIVDSHSKLNVTLEAENDRQIKLKGPSGMNEEHSFTIEKRAYHPSMKGIIGINSVPSGEVGIARHMTLNSNVEDARGFVTLNKENYNGSELESPGELLQTFGVESADMERVAMSISQSKHLVPVDDQCSSLITYDMERLIPYLSSDYAFKAKQDGKVVEIKNDLMIIQYKDGTYDDIDLSEAPDKNTDGGFFIMNQITSNLKVGNTFKKDDILAYNPKYINNNDMFGDPCASIGTLARVMMVANGNVYEDAGFMTDSLAHRLSTKITLQKRVILSRYANIKYMAKVGTKVKVNDPILTFDDTEDEFSSQMLAAMAEEAEDEDEVIASTAPVISKVAGVVKDIYLYYTIPLSEMTPSMKKIVEAYIKENGAKEKTLEKYKLKNSSNSLVKTTEQLTPDYQGKVKGVSVGDGVFIDFYIEYEDVTAVGDKVT